METIRSTRNPRVRELATLSRARVRRERGQHLAEGPNAVAEALAAGVVEEVFVVEHTAPPAVPADVRVTTVSRPVLDRIADATTPQGVVALVDTRRAALSEVVGRGLLVVLDQVADPGNAGTILRTADAAGATGLILTDGSVDIHGPKAIRSAAGSTYHLDVVTGVSFHDVAVACRGTGQRLVGLDGAAATDITSLESDATPVALVLGNEAHGLSPMARSQLDGLVAVPIHGRAESLNVAVAAGIAIYAAARGLRRTADDTARPATST